MQTTPTIPPICIDCQHHREHGSKPRGPDHYCEHPLARHRVTGQSTPAYNMRYQGGVCGREGSLFQAIAP